MCARHTCRDIYKEYAHKHRKIEIENSDIILGASLSYLVYQWRGGKLLQDASISNYYLNITQIILNTFPFLLLSSNLQSKKLSVGVKEVIHVCIKRKILEKLPLQRVEIEGRLNDLVLPRDAFDRLLNA